MSVEEKQNLLTTIDEGVKKKREIAKDFGIQTFTLSTILKN